MNERQSSLVGEGTLAMATIERWSKRFGHVVLLNMNKKAKNIKHRVVPPNRDLPAEPGQLVAEVIRVQPPTPHRVHPNPPVRKGERILLGHGIASFHQALGTQHAVGVTPLDGRLEYWMRPAGIWRAEGQEVRLTFEPLPELGDAAVTIVGDRMRRDLWLQHASAVGGIRETIGQHSTQPGLTRDPGYDHIDRYGVPVAVVIAEDGRLSLASPHEFQSPILVAAERVHMPDERMMLMRFFGWIRRDEFPGAAYLCCPHGYPRYWVDDDRLHGMNEMGSAAWCSAREFTNGFVVGR